MELIFTIVTSILAVKAFKVYRIIDTDKVKFFFLGFFQIAIAYILLLGLNILTFISLKLQFVPTQYVASQVTATMPIGFSLYHLGLLLHLLLLISGIVTLMFMTFNISNVKVYGMLQLTVLIVLLSSYRIIYLFHLLALVYLAYIAAYYYKNFKQKGHKTSLIIFLAFIFLLLGRAQFMFMHAPIFFILGNVLELIGYILLASSLIPILRKTKN